MQLAARWLGVGSVVVGTLGAIALAVSLYPPAPERLDNVGKCDCWNSKVSRDQWAPSPGSSIVAREAGAPVGTCTAYGFGSRTRVVTVDTLLTEANHCLDPLENARVDFNVADDGGISDVIVRESSEVAPAGRRCLMRTICTRRLADGAGHFDVELRRIGPR